MNLKTEKTCDRAGLLENIIQTGLIYAEDEDLGLSDGRLLLSDVTISERVRSMPELLAVLPQTVEDVIKLYYDAENEESLRFTVSEGSDLYDFLPEKSASGMALISLFTKRVLKLTRDTLPVLSVSELFLSGVTDGERVLRSLCAFLLPGEDMEKVQIREHRDTLTRTKILKKGLSVTTDYCLSVEEGFQKGGDLSPGLLSGTQETEREKKLRRERATVLADISGLIREITAQREE